ncbi:MULTISPECIES: carbohydrate kinase [Olivibacter]|uniref:Fructokinase n=1 Tax=Olivibacter oleidegradans TaxID=760123 RepID=A0ABV6HIQ7_9SPHI|nr:carbohydrate kinase [Olivibacter jilunii]
MMKAEILSNPVCIGTGLVALDVVISNEHDVPAQFWAGGSCGNVITILSYFGWKCFPIARLSNNVAAEMLLQDLHKWNVKDDLITATSDGSTPIIIHRILRDKEGAPKHKFEFRNPEDGSYLPSYKPCLAKSVKGLVERIPASNVFYFDRINRGAIDLAKSYKGNGAIVFFEPSSAKDIKGFNECLEITDVVKFSNDRISDYDKMYPIGRVPLEIQTMGESGLKFRLKGESEWTHLESYSIDNVIDSAGAGDWCTAGIIKTLFYKNNSSFPINKDDIVKALRFGQILSAINCTFEGARGLMYAVPNNELLLYVQHIISSSVKKIYQGTKRKGVYTSDNRNLKISSLFASI